MIDPEEDDTIDAEPDADFDLSRQLRAVDQEIRFQKMCDKIEQLGGAPDGEAQADESFLAEMMAFEVAPEISRGRMLVEHGIELPPPDSPSLAEDNMLRDKLWEVIHGLAARRQFLYCTNHLSDRELYTHLWHKTLQEDTKDLTGCGDCACHIDIIENGDPEDDLLYLKFYADDEERALWATTWDESRDGPMPEHCCPPYDRDRHLPKREP